MYYISTEYFILIIVRITVYELLKNSIVSTVNSISNGGAKRELSCCQQMLSVVVFITYPGEKRLYHYTLSNARQQLEATTSQLPWCGSYR